MSSHPFSHRYKSLYDRLSPKVRDHMELERITYPLCVNAVYDSLQAQVSWRDLSMADIDRTIQFSGIEVFSLGSEKHLDVLRSGLKILENEKRLTELIDGFTNCK
jgi:hypothetical protein